MKPISIINFSATLLLFASGVRGISHDPSQNRLVRRISERAPLLTTNDNGVSEGDDAEILLDGLHRFTVTAPFNSASQKVISHESLPIRKAKVERGPPGFGCFFYAPSLYHSDYFVSPVMQVADVKSLERLSTAQMKNPGSAIERGVQDAIIVPENDETAINPTVPTTAGDSQQLHIPRQELPFPARTIFYYRLPNPAEDVLVLLEDGHGKADLYLVKLEQQQQQRGINRIGVLLSPGIGSGSSRGSDISSDFKTILPPTLRRAALITAPNLQRTSCALDINSVDNNGKFDASSPLLLTVPATEVIGLLCKERY